MELRCVSLRDMTIVKNLTYYLTFYKTWNPIEESTVLSLLPRVSIPWRQTQIKDQFVLMLFQTVCSTL
jgi:hypothetical protein